MRHLGWVLKPNPNPNPSPDPNPDTTLILTLMKAPTLMKTLTVMRRLPKSARPATLLEHRGKTSAHASTLPVIVLRT